MGTFGLVLGNLLLTVWVAGGFVLLLLLTRKELGVESQAAKVSLPPRPRVIRPAATLEFPPLLRIEPEPNVIWERRSREETWPAAPIKLPSIVRVEPESDVIWERRRRTNPVQRREAA